MSRPTATRYYLGQPVEAPDADVPGPVDGVEFHDDGALRGCEPKMDATKDGRRCKRGTEGCIAKHKTWRMWGPQLRPEPWA